MVENVQCPVCTLFLHAGMNLSDHLETHPKEQVIKALVQLTVAGNLSSITSGVLKSAAAASVETKTEEQQSDSQASYKSENDMSRCNSRLSTISNSSSTLCSTSTGSLNFATSFSTPPPASSSSAKHTENVESKIPQNFSSNDSRCNTSIPTTSNSPYEQQTSNSNDFYQNRGGGGGAAAHSNDNKHSNYNNSMKAMNFSKNHHKMQQQEQTPPQSHETKQQQQHQMHQSHHQTNSSQLPPNSPHHEHHQYHHQSLPPHSKQNSNTQQQQVHMQENRAAAASSTQQQLPPPPPPPPLPAHRHQHMQQQSQQSSNQMLQPHTDALISTSSTMTFPPTQHASIYTSFGQRQQQQMQLDHQHVKNIYAGGIVLPPPPPLQLFSYQQSMLHQRPPPAYGAAISQIRSQQHQNNKHPPTASIVNPFPYSQIQHAHQQRNSMNNPPPPPRVPMSHHVPSSSEHNSTTATSRSSTLTSNSQLASSSTTTSKHIVQERSASKETVNSYDHQRTSNTLFKSHHHQPHSPHLAPRQHQHAMNTKSNSINHETQQHVDASSQANNNSAEPASEKPLPLSSSSSSSNLNSQTSSISTKSSTVSAITSHASSSVSYCPSSAAASNSRQASSPASSVLRYAESPVAHYLERDNGDFIVQEIPKHIVECVEEDDGGFSVIERFHQSPPSVLHIHDDKEDDDDVDNDDDDDDDVDESQSQSSGHDRKTPPRHPKTEQYEQQQQNDDNADEKEFLSLKKDKQRNNDDADADEYDDGANANVKRENNERSNSTAEVENNSSSSSSNTFNRGGGSSSKKSSKNSITVLSDVQLNLNEYLDLVGNIIASSKIGKRRSNGLASIAPIPLVKVEKEELPDDEEYDAEQNVDNNNLDSSLDNDDRNGNNNNNNNTSMETSELNEHEEIHSPHTHTITSKMETELHIAEHMSSSSTSSMAKSLPSTYTSNPTAVSSSHVTSVIRMASTASSSITSNESNQINYHHYQEQQQQQQQQQPSIDFNHEKSLHSLQNSSVPTDISKDSSIESNENSMAQDLSQQQQQQQQQQSSDERDITIAHACGLPLPPPPIRKGPKKLIIKPKSTKTEENAKNVDYNEPNHVNEMPTTTAAATSCLLRTDHMSHHSVDNNTLSQPQDLIIKLEPSGQEIHCSSNNDDDDDSSESFELHMKKSQNQLQHQQNQVHVDADVDGDGERNQFNIQETEAKYNIKCKTEKVPHTDNDNANSFSDSHRCTVSDEAVDYRPIKCERVSNKSYADAEEKTISAAETNSATDDARVLLDFANSSKCAGNGNMAAGGGNIFSPHSMFSGGCPPPPSSKISEHSNSKNDSSTATGVALSAASSVENSLRCEDEFIAMDEHELHEIMSSNYSSSNLPKQYNQTRSQEVEEQQSHQQPHSSFPECPFSSFFYNNNNNGNGGGINDHHPMTRPSSANQFSSSNYQQTPEATTTAATVASSGSTLDTLEDSTISTPGPESIAITTTTNNRFGSVQGALPQWYQSATLVANSDFESAMSIDNAAVDGDVVGKYLDLDACKKENSYGDVHQMAPTSSTSSSFAAATDSSLPSGCTNDALNIRTDEKMPPKGEISEQESNCDIENSWSQPVYGEIPSKFYRTSFPGIFPQDHAWNNEEFFTVQDLSHSANAAAQQHVANNNGKIPKSFDFHLPLEATPTTFVNSNLQLLHDDVFPSTSLGVKKKRKRISSSEAASSNKTDRNRSKPTATITSQQFLQSAQMSTTAETNEAAPAHQQQPKPTTSSAALMAAAAVAPASAAAAPPSAPRTRKKIYKCPHCSTEFSKLRDRNSHMIHSHNYVRQNRRLISSQPIAAAESGANNTNTDASVISASETLLTFRNNGANGGVSARTEDVVLDTKHIKIEMEYMQQQTSSGQLISQSQSEMDLHHEGIETKEEFFEEKGSLPAMTHAENYDEAALQEDRKPNLNQTTQAPPLSNAPPTTKLATLYRMLISYNVSTLKQNTSLTEFEEKMISNSIFFCYICHQNFTSVKLYDAHLTEHPAECFTCGKKFHRWKNFSLHLKRHLGWKEFACTVCDKKFVVRSALVEHTRMHTGHSPLKCKICGKTFKRYSNLTQHRKRHGRLAVRKKEYVCYCGEVLPSKARFLWHKETHDSKPKCCPHCCDRFVHANSLRRHIRLAHSDKFDYAEPMECPMCKQVFAKSSIKAHMATHSMDTQHDCNICNKSFSTKWNLKIHLWVHANRTAKPFKCEHCPKAFVREVDFKNHMNAHKQIKPYTCEYCGCKFIRKYNYMRHRREHHGNKKFTCELCKKSFHRHYYLIEHRRIHTGERPFQCTICGKSSTTKTNHNKHLKIHHSRDPFTVET